MVPRLHHTMARARHVPAGAVAGSCIGVGAILCNSDSNPTMVNRTIAGSTSFRDRGGIPYDGGSPAIIDCVISK